MERIKELFVVVDNKPGALGELLGHLHPHRVPGMVRRGAGAAEHGNRGADVAHGVEAVHELPHDLEHHPRVAAVLRAQLFQDEAGSLPL